ncbi:hypothetical protein Ahy_A06g029154 isoform D [Arachis hypogaea]|uniref:60S ribosomal protein L6 n=1 Tax=Arachis hypogaea TaxID=3818 RepID=A0A445CSM6_ARAHY|nr:hypothetical protein Ahy_A06g029154 isoform D [Arachis hypogaea]
MAPKQRAARKVGRNPELVRGIGKYSRSQMYHKRGLWAIKAKNGGKFPVHEPKPKPQALAQKPPKFYPAEDVKTPLVNKHKPKPTKLRASITPGTVLILLAGRFKGKRVVFLKQLPSGLLLVSGPFKINGVPLRRVNQSYVIATSTKVDVSACNVEKFDDKYFSKEVQKKKKKGEGEFFESEKEEKKTLPQDKKDDQKTVDSALIKAIESVPDLKFYLGARFSLKQGQKPHELCWPRYKENIGLDLMDSRKRKQRQEESDSDSESESEPSDESEESSPAEKEKKKKKIKTTPKKTQQKKKKVVVEDSPPEEDQYFDGERYEISSDELDEWLRENVDKSAAEGENQAELRSTEGRYVSSQTLPAVNLGSDDPSSQGRTEQSSVNQPSQSMLIPTDSNMMVVREQTPSEALAVTPEPPKQLQETTPKLPPAPTKIHPAAEDAAALLMMAWTATYVPKTDPGMPSFSLGLTDSSQEGASTQETERKKSPETASMLEQLDNLVQKLASNAAKGKDESPQIQRETGGESSAKFQTPGGINQIPDDMKQKCYMWGTRPKEDADGDTNEYEEMCTLIGQGEYILMRMHLASLQAKSDIESQIFARVCHSGHWWLWLINTTKRKCQILDPLHKKAPSDERKDINKFTGYVFSRLITYAGGEPLAKGENEKKIKASYVKISGEKTSYDCAIYVMKWLELIEPENIKKGKYEWDNWPQC